MNWRELIEVKLPQEKDIERRLHQELGGQRQVKLPNNRRIDLLTEQELIEIKHIKYWGVAITQIANYSQYYPNHSKRIHLFGLASVSHGRTTFENATQVCQQLGISVTWEP